MPTFVEKLAFGSDELDRKRELIKWFVASVRGYRIANDAERYPIDKDSPFKDKRKTYELEFTAPNGVVWSFSYTCLSYDSGFVGWDRYFGYQLSKGSELKWVEKYPVSTWDIPQVYESLDPLAEHLQELFPSLREFFAFFAAAADVAATQRN